jgi:hypothetical protein
MACFVVVTSTRSSPDRNFLTDFASPIVDCRPLWIRNGDTLLKSPSASFIIKNLARALEHSSTFPEEHSERSAHEAENELLFSAAMIN